MNIQLNIFNQPIIKPANDVLASGSLINEKKLAGQNFKVLEYLKTGKTLNMFSAWDEIGVRHPFARVNDLRKIHNEIIYSKQVKIKDTSCKEYSLTEFI